MPSPRTSAAPRRKSPGSHQGALQNDRGEFIYGPIAEFKPEDHCPRCGESMDRVLDRGTLCWDQLLELMQKPVV